MECLNVFQNFSVLLRSHAKIWHSFNGLFDVLLFFYWRTDVDMVCRFSCRFKCHKSTFRLILLQSWYCKCTVECKTMEFNHSKTCRYHRLFLRNKPEVTYIWVVQIHISWHLAVRCISSYLFNYSNLLLPN